MTYIEGSCESPRRDQIHGGLQVAYAPKPTRRGGTARRTRTHSSRAPRRARTRSQIWSREIPPVHPIGPNTDGPLDPAGISGSLSMTPRTPRPCPAGYSISTPCASVRLLRTCQSCRSHSEAEEVTRKIIQCRSAPTPRRSPQSPTRILPDSLSCSNERSPRSQSRSRSSVRLSNRDSLAKHAPFR